MKSIYKNNVFGVAAVLALLAGTCAAADKAQTGAEITRLPADVSEIYIEAGNMVSITFVKTADTISVSEVINNNKAEKPVTLERQGTKMVIKVAGYGEESKPKSGAMATILKLHVPEGRNISIVSRNVVVSGVISAKNLTVKTNSVSMHALKVAASESVSVQSGYAQLKFTLTGAKKLTIAADKADGKITVPASTEVVCPEKEGLQIVRAAAAKGHTAKKP